MSSMVTIYIVQLPSRETYDKIYTITLCCISYAGPPKRFRVKKLHKPVHPSHPDCVSSSFPASPHDAQKACERQCVRMVLIDC